jgi:hypothetical protein
MSRFMTTILGAAVLAVALQVGWSRVARAEGPDTATGHAGVQWGYICSGRVPIAGFEYTSKSANELGKMGWELVAVPVFNGGSLGCFKRPLQH